MTALGEIQMRDLLDAISIAVYTEVHLFQVKTPLSPKFIKSSSYIIALMLHSYNSFFIYKKQVVEVI